MTDEKKKMTAHNSSVGADDGQSISQNSKFTIPDPDEKSNSPGKEIWRNFTRKCAASATQLTSIL